MAEPFIGQIMLWAPNFAPRGWAFCSGQLLSISQNPALFSILGTIYGGDGRTTFGLPDLRGRVPVHPGTGPGLPTVRLGEKSGSEEVTLTANQLGGHTHTAFQTTKDEANQVEPTVTPTRRLAAGKLTTGQDLKLYNAATPDKTIGGAETGSTGGSQAHTNMQPFQALHYIIALVGIFPSRS